MSLMKLIRIFNLILIIVINRATFIFSNQEIFSNRTMKRNFHSLIFKACFTIIVISFVNVLVAKTIKGEKSDSKVDLNFDKPKGKESESMMQKQINDYLS